MKKLFIIVALIMTANLSAQILKFDKQSPEPIVITSSKGERIKVRLELSGKIEIDGHVFENKKSKDPIIFEANLDGIEIYNSKNEYQKRNCKIKDCNVLHLEPKNYGNTISNGIQFFPNYNQNNTLELKR